MDKSNGQGQSQGQGGANVGVQPQLQPGPPPSQYFQSFDASHFTHPSSGRRPHPTYTASQKDEAIQLLNDGYSAKMIAGQIGGSCSKSNPYRWRAEKREREQLLRQALESLRIFHGEQWVINLGWAENDLYH